MLRGSAHAAPLSMLWTFCGAARSEASGNFTQDRQARANFFVNRTRSPFWGAQAASLPSSAACRRQYQRCNNLEVESSRAFRQGCRKEQTDSLRSSEFTASRERNGAVFVSLRGRWMPIRWRPRAARSISCRPICLPRALPWSRRKAHPLLQWCACCAS